MEREEHNKIAKIENKIWEIAKILQPNSVLDDKKIKEVELYLLKIFKE